MRDIREYRETDVLSDLESLMDFIGAYYEKMLPFNRLLDLKIISVRPDQVCTMFEMREELIGNTAFSILHGGVISSVIDATGGLTVTAGALKTMVGATKREVENRLTKIGTIDLRIDYLRPGKGTRFFATGIPMRTGRKVAMTRMDLVNEKDVLIAVGSGTYIIG